MKRIILSFIFVLCTCTLFAQGRVYGTIHDASVKENLPFVNIVILKLPDSTQVKGGTSGDNGKFSFELPNGKYTLKVSSLGYNIYTSSPFVISSSQKEKNMGIIYMEANSTQLEAAEVMVQKPLLEQEAGKMIMNVSASATSDGDNALELLKKFPGVVVDQNDKITYNGQSIQVMIDNRPTYASGDELANLLKNMSGSEVEKLEAIANPSSKFDAEGTGGIINIKTKRNKTVGFNGSVNAGLGSNMRGKLRTSDGFDLNYRNNDVIVYGKLDYSYNQSENGSRSKAVFADGRSFSTNYEEGELWSGEGSGSFINFKGGVDYFLNSKNNFGFSVRHMKGNHEQTGTLNTRVGIMDSILTSYTQKNKNDWGWGNTNVSLNYQYITDSALNRFVFVDANWIHQENSGEGYNLIDYYSGNFDRFIYKEGYELIQPLSSTILSLKADYEHPFANKKSKLEVGTKFSKVKNDNEQIYNVEGVRDTLRSDRYIYNEDILAAYTMFTHQLSGKTSLQLGLRAEYTFMEGNSLTVKDSTANLSKGYPGLFPSFNIFHQISPKHKVDFGYRYRLSRPHFSSLNPFVYRSDANSFRSGNPYLAPEYSQNLSLGYSYNYKLFVNLSYSHSDGVVNYLTAFDTTNHTTLSSPSNSGTSDNLTASVNGVLTFFKIWTTQIGAWAYMGQSNIDYFGKQEIRPSRGGSLWFNSELALKNKLSFEVSGWGRPMSKDEFQTSQGMFMLNLGVKKTFFDGKLNLRLSINDVLGTGRWESESYYPDGSYNYSRYEWGGTSIFLRVQYRFGNQSLQLKQRKQASSNEESDRLGGSGGSGSSGGGQ